MQFRFGLSLAVLLVAVAARGHAELQCYVCDNCAKIDKTTPLETCGPAAPATTVGTPTDATTTEATTPTTTTTPAAAPSTTEEHTTEELTTTQSTAFPTPPTVGPTSSTTGLPTPPNVGPIIAEVFELAKNHSHTHEPSVNITSPQTAQPVYFVTPSHEGGSATVQPTVIVTPMHNHTAEHNASAPLTLLLRQRRNIPVDGMTYHCFKVEKKYNGVYGIQRGCMGVLTQQSVCSELKTANNNQTKKCQPCSTSMCNSSSTLGVSIATLLVALVALVFRG